MCLLNSAIYYYIRWREKDEKTKFLIICLFFFFLNLCFGLAGEQSIRLKEMREWAPGSHSRFKGNLNYCVKAMLLLFIAIYKRWKSVNSSNLGVRFAIKTKTVLVRIKCYTPFTPKLVSTSVSVLKIRITDFLNPMKNSFVQFSVSNAVKRNLTKHVLLVWMRY